MFSVAKPSHRVVESFIQQQSDQPFTYTAIGATANCPPSGFVVDHTRQRIGFGRTQFERAQRAIQNWEQFQIGWVDPCWPTTPIQEGSVIVVRAHACGLWFLNACRVVYLVDESQQDRRFGFAYGTLKGHAESGEERFTVEWHEHDDSVWYDILAFSRPGSWYSRLAYPLVRRLQRRFALDSVEAMIRALDSGVA